MSVELEIKSPEVSQDPAFWLDPELYQEHGGLMINIQTLISRELFARTKGLCSNKGHLIYARNIFEGVEIDAMCGSLDAELSVIGMRFPVLEHLREESSLAIQAVGGLIAVFNSGVYPKDGESHYWNHFTEKHLVVPSTIYFVDSSLKQIYFIELFTKVLDDFAQEIVNIEAKWRAGE